MSELPTRVRVAQATGIILAATAAGANVGLSVFVIPRILESPTPLMLRQWYNMFRVSSRALPGPFLLPGFISLWLAYTIPEKSRLYAVAAALSLSVTPWTWVMIIPVNKKLSKKAAEVKSLDAGPGDVLPQEFGRDDETAHALVDSWGLRNLYRSAACFLASSVGLYAALS